MECFNVIWPRCVPEPPPPWTFSTVSASVSAPDLFQMDQKQQQDLRDTLRRAAKKHSSYYKTFTEENCGVNDEETKVCCNTDNKESRVKGNCNMDEEVSEKCRAMATTHQRTRRRGVFEMDSNNANANENIAFKKHFLCVSQKLSDIAENVENRSLSESEDFEGFKSVKALKERYQKMIEHTAKNLNELTPVKSKESDEIFLMPPPSGYCSSTASDDEKERGFWNSEKNWLTIKQQVKRSGSSDSAVGLTPSDDEAPPPFSINQEVSEEGEYKHEENVYGHETECGDCKDCAVNKLLNEEIRSPYSPRGSIDHENVPTRTLIEANYIPAPLDRKMSECGSVDLGLDLRGDSRRQSCITDDGEDVHPRYRYWRTPSVVVSDYSDDVTGLTLDEVEYFRNRRREASSSADSSLHSSCSNLNYCGSTISSLDADRLFRKPYRKGSDCSLCSFSGDENENDDSPDTTNNPMASGWRKLRNIVQWTPFFQTYKKQRYPWVQLAGHQGNFKAGPDQGTILKKLCSKEEKCFKILMKDRLRPYVPEYKGLITSDDGDCSYLQLQDLLGDFVSPCVMDCKIGVRTYLEEELAKAKEKPKLRKDMYEKMCQIDPNAPTDEEHRLKGVTKPRYMVWRETISSTATLGFRIEGIRKADGSSTKDFKTTRTKEQILDAFAEFTGEFPHSVPKYIQRLKAIKATLESSDFFNSHEVIGSSLLFVHDKHTANVWLIDFAKTILLPSDVQIDHNSKWKVGNHEDGYMIGINNLINLFKTLLERQPVFVSPPECLPDPPLDIDEDETKTETEETSTNDKTNHHKEEEESIHTTNQRNLEID